MFPALFSLSFIFSFDAVTAAAIIIAVVVHLTLFMIQCRNHYCKVYFHFESSSSKLNSINCAWTSLSFSLFGFERPPPTLARRSSMSFNRFRPVTKFPHTHSSTIVHACSIYASEYTMKLKKQKHQSHITISTANNSNASERDRHGERQSVWGETVDIRMRARTKTITTIYSISLKVLLVSEMVHTHTFAHSKHRLHG